jgi:hypothetical protein
VFEGNGRRQVTVDGRRVRFIAARHKVRGERWRAPCLCCSTHLTVS